MCPRIHSAAAMMLTLTVTACAIDGAPAEGNWAPVQQEYRMGSRIPVRDRSPALTKEERQRQADAAADDLRRMQRSGAAPGPAGGG